MSKRNVIVSGMDGDLCWRGGFMVDSIRDEWRGMNA